MRMQGSRLVRATLVGVWLIAPGMLRAQSGASPPAPADTAAYSVLHAPIANCGL